MGSTIGMMWRNH